MNSSVRAVLVVRPGKAAVDRSSLILISASKFKPKYDPSLSQKSASKIIEKIPLISAVIFIINFF